MKKLLIEAPDRCEKQNPLLGGGGCAESPSQEAPRKEKRQSSSEFVFIDANISIGLVCCSGIPDGDEERTCTSSLYIFEYNEVQGSPKGAERVHCVPRSWRLSVLSQAMYLIC